MMYLFIFSAALAVSAVLTRLVRDTAIRCGWVEAPKAARHLHEQPIPRLGGIAILSSVVAAVAVTVVASNLLHGSVQFSSGILLGLLGPTLLIFALGLADDFRPLSPYVKFGVQILAAGWLYLSGYGISRLQLVFGDRQLGTAAELGLTILWVLLITNAFNLLDGLDGLAAGSALFASLVVFVVSLVTGNSLTQLVTIALAGAIVGFLRYNFNPATIFLGDCGSLVIGFVLSAVSLASSVKAPTAVAVAIPVVSFGLPILDTMMAVLRRFLNRRPLFHPDREHIHHKLLQRGLTHRQAVIVLYAVSASFALISLPLLSPQSSTIAVVLTIVGLGVFFGLQHLGYAEVDEIRRAARRTWDQKTIITNNLAIRRAKEELAQAESMENICRILQTAFERNDDFDGFKFTFRAEGHRPHGALEQIVPVHYEWNRGQAAEDQVRGWALQLDLLSDSGELQGAFSLKRSYSTRALRSDIDCLTDGFSVALASALRRTSQSRPPMLTLETQVDNNTNTLNSTSNVA